MNTRTERLGLALALLTSWSGCSNAHGGPSPEEGDAATPAIDAGPTDAGAHDAGAAGYARACAISEPTAESGSCKSDRRLLECKTPGGGGLDCLFQSCAEAEDFRADRCHDLCAPDEFAASCGGIGPNAASNAPPNPACGDALATPGGVVFYCCPCGAN